MIDCRGDQVSRAGAGGGRADKRKLKKAIDDLTPIQASCLEVTGQVNQGIMVEALKNYAFTTS